jgi:hypothetical protein
MKKTQLLILSTLAIFAAMGCQADPEWKAEHVSTLDGFHVPESALHSPKTGTIFVTNIECEPDNYWVDNNKGYISVVDGDHRVKTRRWVESKPESRLHGPKGMCLLGDTLYFTDNTRLMQVPLSGGTPSVLVSGFKQANDLATDGKNIWVSDTAAGKIFCVTPQGTKREIQAPAGINGLTFFDDKMFGVSWDLHEVYELDPSGKSAPVAFGLADHFKNLDGIEVLDDGTFIVSDFMGDTVYTINPDRRSVHPLIKINSPADIGLNRKAGLLYVPQFMKDKLSVYQLKKIK